MRRPLRRIIDITPGQRFGRWTVLARAPRPRGTRGRDAWFRVRCDCGTERVVRAKFLRSGKSKSCGCLKRDNLRAAKFIDLTGQTFGDWTVLALHSSTRHRETKWLCRCVCGDERPVLANSLRGGHSTNHGCRKAEKQARRMRKHGLSGTRAYSLWRSIKQRCFNPNHPSFRYYGGRGLGMQEEWQHDVVAFACAIGELGELPEGRSLDRIDNDRGYVRGNLKWSTPREQVLNRRPRKNKRSSLAQLLEYQTALARAPRWGSSP